MMDGITILKESGELEKFNRQKILNSLMSAGLRPQEADEIIDKVTMALQPPLSTRKVFRAVKKFLRQKSIPSTIRYALKQAIFDLGPTGYPFEKYVARILAARGYSVEVGISVKGRCVNHEVDVMAYKDSECYIVECKFHHNSKNKSNIKTALYVNSRFHDILQAQKADRKNSHITYRGMLVTNTRFSLEAIKYAECAGLTALGWKYPRHESLEQIITMDKTYPITILPSVNRKNIASFISHDLVLAQDITDKSEEELIETTALDQSLIRRLKKQACLVCD